MLPQSSGGVTGVHVPGFNGGNVTGKCWDSFSAKPRAGRSKSVVPEYTHTRTYTHIYKSIYVYIKQV